MRRSIQLLGMLALTICLMTPAEGSFRGPRCQTVAAGHRIPRRLVRHRSTPLPQPSSMPVITSSPSPPAVAPDKPAVLVATPDRTALVPSHDTEVWPPAWGLFPAE